MLPAVILNANPFRRKKITGAMSRSSGHFHCSDISYMRPAVYEENSARRSRQESRSSPRGRGEPGGADGHAVIRAHICPDWRRERSEEKPSPEKRNKLKENVRTNHFSFVCRQLLEIILLYFSWNQGWNEIGVVSKTKRQNDLCQSFLFDKFCRQFAVFPLSIFFWQFIT